MSKTITITQKFRLYPNKPEIQVLEDTLEICREVNNSLLNDRKFQYETEKKSVSYNTQAKYFRIWKKSHEELLKIHSTVLQDVAKRVDLAFEAFFDRCKKGETPGFPRNKGKNQYNSIKYTQSGFKIINEQLYLSKIGYIKIRQHRPIEGIIKTCTVKKYSNGKWFVCFSVEIEVEEKEISFEKEIGIDVGITKFIALSDGEFVENPRFFRKAEENLAKAQRKFDRVKNQHGSKARKKAKKIVSKAHDKIKNKRLNFLHQESRKIANRYDIVFMEKLNVKNMSKSPKPKPDPENPGQYLPNGKAAKAGLNKSIQDVSWSMFRKFITYKVENTGGKVITNNPAYTSQMCSCCGYISEENRKTQADFICTNPDTTANCVYRGHADTNSARNQITVGHDSVAFKKLRSPCL